MPLSFFITNSAQPLLVETLPALKLTQFRTDAPEHMTYAYLRCYMHEGAFVCNATAFCEKPAEDTSFQVCVCFVDAPQNYLCLCVTPLGACTLTLRSSQSDAVLQTLQAPSVQQTQGADEQGAYWSAQSTLAASVFEAAFGRVPCTGDVLLGNVFLHEPQKHALAMVYGVSSDAAVPTAQGMGTWNVVPY